MVFAYFKVIPLDKSVHSYSSAEILKRAIQISVTSLNKIYGMIISSFLQKGWVSSTRLC